MNRPLTDSAVIRLHNKSNESFLDSLLTGDSIEEDSTTQELKDPATLAKELTDPIVRSIKEQIDKVEVPKTKLQEGTGTSG